MKFHLALMLLLASWLNPAGASAKENKIIIALVGDSTVTNSAGWGLAFARHFDERVIVKNFAISGRSSKSYFNEGRLTRALESKPDYVFIQFGHNGQAGKGPKRETDPATSYRDFLRLYVTEFRKAGAKPILVSSVTRRIFDRNDKIISTLSPWADACAAVASEMKAPFIDLHRSSISLHNKMGPGASKSFNPKEGDYTHFNAVGATAVAKLVAQGLKQTVPELAGFLKNDPQTVSKK